MKSSLQQKGRGAFWLLGLIVIILGCATAWSVLRFRTDSNLVEHSHVVITAVSDLGADVIEAESAVRGFMINGRSSYLDEFEAQRSEAVQSSAALRREVADSREQTDRVQRLSNAVSRRLQQLEDIAKDRQAGATTDTISRNRGVEARLLIAEIRKLIHEATNYEEDVLKVRRKQRGWAEVAVLSLCAFGTLTCLALMWTGNRSMNDYETVRDRTLDELERVNIELERRVLDRTAKISQANVELKKSQSELSALAGTLKRSNIELESFAYAATHDLQEPLRTITSFAQLLEKRAGATLADDNREYLQTIVGASQRMSDLIQGLLDYSRVNREPTDGERVDVMALLVVVKNNLASQIRDSGAEITCSELPELPGNRIQLLRLLQNLIGNSVKYRSAERPCRIDLSAGREESFWHFRLEDNGQGFDQEYSTQIFGLFKRLNRSSPGAGVGLALCQSIVERAGGTIWAEGVDGEGSTFHFTWPASRGEENA